MKVTSAKQLSACIKDARLSQKLSQGKVAEKVGIRQDGVFQDSCRVNLF